MNAPLNPAVVATACVGPIGRVDIFHDLSAAEPLWRRLEAEATLGTPYQRFDFMAPWQRHVGSRAGITPLIVIASDPAGRPLMLLPLGLRRFGPLGIAGFLGGKHVNFNLALWRRETLAAIGPGEIAAVLDRLAATGGIDLLALANQPLTWDGCANPLALLPHQPSPSFGWRGALAADFATLAASRFNGTARKKLRKKERSLAAHGPLRCWQAASADEARRVIDVFFEQKAARMRERGIADVFAAPGMREFITTAATERLADGRPAIELHVLAVGERILAVFGGVADDRRFSGMFNSITRCPLAHESPGELLLIDLVRHCCARGLATFDLGVGEADYKRTLCSEPEPLVDSIVPLTTRGRAAAALWRLKIAAKRRIKHSPAIWRAIGAARRMIRSAQS